MVSVVHGKLGFAVLCNKVTNRIVYHNTQLAGTASFWALVAICTPSAVIVAR